MPKEMIYGSQMGEWVQVGWSKDASNAQLGVAIARNFVFTDASGKRIEDTEVYSKFGAPGVAHSLYFTFTSRDQINHLIRELRKARDGAFGKDE